MKVFYSKWCKWINHFFAGESVGIKVNEDIGHYIQNQKGPRKGDPLSPMVFNVVADMLAILVAPAKEDDQMEVFIPHLVDGGVSLFQYTNGTIIFMA